MGEKEAREGRGGAGRRRSSGGYTKGLEGWLWRDGVGVVGGANQCTAAKLMPFPLFLGEEGEKHRVAAH